jgi:hypothetical protein
LLSGRLAKKGIDMPATSAAMTAQRRFDHIGTSVSG